MRDRFGRTIDYLRVSVTERCNLRCRYCAPEGSETAPDALRADEIVSVCAAAASLGVTRLKLTGGEPLLRPDLAALTAALKAIPGIEQVTLTTNGVLLARQLPALLAAGLDAVNISLDTLDRARYAAMTGCDALPAVLDGIRAALDAPVRVKLNAVLLRGVNDGDALSLAALAEDNALDVRFIELMPLGAARGLDGLSNDALLARLQENYPALTSDDAVHGNGPAVYYRAPGWRGSVGFISAVHGVFCGGCNRLRLTARGLVKPCLCYGDTVDLRPALALAEPERAAALTDALRRAIEQKPRRHCFEQPARITETARMSGIGG